MKNTTETAVLRELLERIAGARELVDVNIAAGIALEELEALDT